LYKKNENPGGYAPADDPGVKSVTRIYNYYKKFGYHTQIMGASFRNKDEITELAGCDLLTISPALLEELKNATAPPPRKLDPQIAKTSSMEKLHLDEKTFRYLFNEEAMATEKLAEGIRNFVKDIIKLKSILKAKF